MKRLFFPFFLFLLSPAAFTQPGTLEALEGEVYEYLNEYDQPNANRSTEYIILFLKISRYGQVERVTMMNDQYNQDSTYMLLNKITPRHFRRWQSDKYKNKLIIVPVFSQGFLSPPNYLDIMRGSAMLTFEQCGYKGDYDFIISHQVYYNPPYGGPIQGCGIMINHEQFTRQSSSAVKPQEVVIYINNEPMHTGRSASDILTRLEPSVTQNDYRDIYTAVLKEYYGNKIQSIIVKGTARNHELQRMNFSELAAIFGTRDDIMLLADQLDSSWRRVFKITDSLKWKVTKRSIPSTECSPYSIVTVPPDTLSAIRSRLGPFGIETTYGYCDIVEFSDIVFFENYAIVDMSRYSGPLDAQGTIFFLQKIQGAWVIRGSMGTWMS